MNPKRFVMAIILFALVGWGSFISIVIYSAPEEGLIILALFYLSLAVGMFSVLTLFNFYLRRMLLDSYRDQHRVILSSLRQGLILTLFFSALLILRGLEIWNTVALGIIFLLFIIVELYLSFNRKL